jgi:hypothetical protein
VRKRGTSRERTERGDDVSVRGTFWTVWIVVVPGSDGQSFLALFLCGVELYKAKYVLYGIFTEFLAILSVFSKQST